MFTNRVSRIHRLAARSRRYSSQHQKTYPFDKLRALPFGISPEDAIAEMAPYASVTCLFPQLLGSLGARYLPGFGFKPFRPVRITPVYFPGWIIDAQVSLDVVCGDVQHRITGGSKDSYFPGSDFRVLSWVSYGSDSSLDMTVPFTEDLKHQHGVDVTCIPYTISPFAGLSMADAATESILLKNDLSMVPKSIDTHLFAAYPVLFPLYLAQYEYPVPGKERLVTLFIEASEPNGRIRSEKLDTGSDVRGMFPLAPKSFVDFTHALDEVDVPCLHGDPAPFFRLFGFQLPSEKRDLSRTLRRQLDEAVVSHGMGPKLVEESGIISSSDDPRIRPYTMEERENVREWLSLSQQIESMSRVAESIRKTHDLTIANDKEFPQEVFNKTIESLESKIAELQAEQKATTPEWWKDWQNIPQ